MTTSYRGRIAESIEDLMSQAHYMTAKCRVDGNLTFDGHGKTVEELDNESRCRSLCVRIERALTECALEEVTGLLEMYELLYRIGYGTQPSSSFLSYHRNRVYTAWRAGNRNIQESQIYRLLKKSTNGIHLLCKIRQSWVKTLLKHKCFPNVTTYENYQRLGIIMRENIDKLTPVEAHRLEIACGDKVREWHQEKYARELKREWYEANRVEDLSTLSLPLLKSYRSFIASCFPAVLTREEQEELDAEITSELLSRSDLNTYDRKAFETISVTNSVFVK